MKDFIVARNKLIKPGDQFETSVNPSNPESRKLYTVIVIELIQATLQLKVFSKEYESAGDLDVMTLNFTDLNRKLPPLTKQDKVCRAGMKC